MTITNPTHLGALALTAVFAISATFAPSRAARTVIARPIPRLPPDMNMTRPWRLMRRI